MKTSVAMFVAGLVLLAGCQCMRAKCTCGDAQAKSARSPAAPAGGAVWSGDATEEGTVEVTSACADKVKRIQKKFIFKTKQAAKKTAKLFATNWHEHHEDICPVTKLEQYMPGTYENAWIVEFDCRDGKVPEIWCDEDPCDGSAGTLIPIGPPGILCRGHYVWRVEP